MSVNHDDTPRAAATAAFDAAHRAIRAAASAHIRSIDDVTGVVAAMMAVLSDLPAIGYPDAALTEIMRRTADDIEAASRARGARPN